MGKHLGGLGVGAERQPVGCVTRSQDLHAIDAGSRYGGSHRERRLGGGVALLSPQYSLPRDQTCCNSTFRKPVFLISRAWNQAKGFGDLSRLGKDLHPQVREESPTGTDHEASKRLHASRRLGSLSQ